MANLYKAFPFITSAVEAIYYIMILKNNEEKVRFYSCPNSRRIFLSVCL